MQMSKLDVHIKFLDANAAAPEYGTAGSAGIDLRAMLPGRLVLQPNETEKIRTGIAIHISDPNYAALILPRSGLGSKGLVIGNLVGLIDSDYQGELTITAWNRSNTPMVILPLDRIAQLIFVPIAHANFIPVEDFSEETERGTGGYGSTGVK
jgi:dUTP pyrophosphatase